MVALCVFDAYGTLFDVDAAARAASAEPGGATLAAHLAGPVGRLAAQAVGIYMAAQPGRARMSISGKSRKTRWIGRWTAQADDPGLRARLLDLYRRLDPFPEVPEVLRALQAQGLRLAILSNGSAGMLAEAVAAAGLDGVFDAVVGRCGGHLQTCACRL